MLIYRKMRKDEVGKILEIDATYWIKNAWRRSKITGEYELQEINWMDESLPNGIEWHKKHFEETITKGGKAFGCFDKETLVGYATIEAKVFGIKERYVLLDQLFVSNAYRKQGIGRKLVGLCMQQLRCLVQKRYIFVRVLQKIQ